jgi:hypothetical protein
MSGHFSFWTMLAVAASWPRDEPEQGISIELDESSRP